jgi:hypothetical protein
VTASSPEPPGCQRANRVNLSEINAKAPKLRHKGRRILFLPNGRRTIAMKSQTERRAPARYIVQVGKKLAIVTALVLGMSAGFSGTLVGPAMAGSDDNGGCHCRT